MTRLFAPYQLGHLGLSNRIVMAPMTRSRAIGNVANDLMASYYAQRASAGLLITEGTSPSPNGLGYSRIPGIFTTEQTEGWKKVTDAVHAKAGKIFLQLMHTGRVGHPANLPKGGRILGPSVVKLETTKMWVDGQGLLDIPAAAPMTPEDIEDAIAEFIQAAVNAIDAGFDGVEVHAANGYLINQFLNGHTNRRKDEYGGDIENRARFLLEVVAGIADAIGPEKVGVRISPHGTFNELVPDADEDALYMYVAAQLGYSGIAYLHVNDQGVKGEPFAPVKKLRALFKNTVIVAGGYDATKAEAVLQENEADLVAFARTFLSNPDLVERFKNRLPLNQPKYDLFYTPGPEGYVDYPVFEDVQIIA
ncbi:MAG TPA: alkene reductase [Chryseosolibacter sp.]|nr:alkene reductase [Chryseosolibacter sp.]